MPKPAATTTNIIPRLKVPAYRKVNMVWIAAAAALPGRTANVAIAIWSLVCATGRVAVELTPATLRRYGVSREAGHDALSRMAQAGLLALDRARGRHPRLTVLGQDGLALVLPADFPIRHPG
jgi:hypothetical protein